MITQIYPNQRGRVDRVVDKEEEPQGRGQVLIGRLMGRPLKPLQGEGHNAAGADMSGPRGSITGNNPSCIVSALTVFLLYIHKCCTVPTCNYFTIFYFLVVRTLFEPEPDLNLGPGSGPPIFPNRTFRSCSGSGPGCPNPNRTGPRPV
jgi:hypothetical protein